MAEPKLTAKQAAFVQEYLGNGQNASAAYRAVYDATGQADTICTSASRLLKHPAVAPLVAEAEAAAEAQSKEAIKRFALDKAGAIEILCQVALHNVGDVFDWDENGPRLKSSDKVPPHAKVAISEVRRSKEGDVSIKFLPRTQAVMDLAKLQGWIIDRSQFMGASGQPVDPAGGVTVYMDFGEGPRLPAETTTRRSGGESG